MRKTRILRNLFFILLFLLGLNLGVFVGWVVAQLSSGQIVYLTDGSVAVVNPDDGKRRVLSDNANPAQGPKMNSVFSLEVAKDGTIYVLSPGKIYKVDAVSGHRTIVTDFENSSQGPSVRVEEFTVGQGGNIFVLERNFSNGLYQVDPNNGNRTRLGNQIPTSQVRDVAVTSDGTILVVAASGGSRGHGAIFSLDFLTSQWRRVVDFDDATKGTPLFPFPNSIKVTPNGTILVFPSVISPDTNKGICSVNLSSGTWTFLDLTSINLRPVDGRGYPDGRILLWDAPQLVLLNTDNLDLTVVSNFLDASQGPTTWVQDFAVALGSSLPPECNSDSDNAACTELCEIREIAKVREGTVDELYAKFWLCLNEGACDEYMKTGDQGIAGGFNKFMFNYFKAHPQQSALKYRCDEAEIQVPDEQERKVVCFAGTGEYHFENELRPGFRSYCSEVSPDQYDAWDEQHTRFVENINLPCFDTLKDIFPSEGHSFWLMVAAGLQTRVRAELLREETQQKCFEDAAAPSSQKLNVIATSSQSSSVLSPPTKEDLFSEELAAVSTLKVTAKDENLFFLPVGAQVQLQVTKRNPDGSLTDFTSSPGTTYSLTLAKQFVSVSPKGKLSILEFPGPFVIERPVLYVVVHNGSDVGTGQFALIDKDEDSDGFADSYEVRFGLDPNTPNNANSDIDGDGLSDPTELMLNTLPTVKDTDGDGFSDKAEFDAGTDPRDASRHPEGARSENCGNCVDDNENGLVDLFDPQCSTSELTLKSGVLSLDSDAAEDKLTLQGTFSVNSGSIHPSIEGVTVNLTDANGQVTCFNLPAGAGWKADKNKWTFTDDKTGLLGTSGAKELLSLQYNAKKGYVTLKASVSKTDLNGPDAGVIFTAVSIGDKGVLNTQAWQLDKKGKKLTTPVKTPRQSG